MPNNAAREQLAAALDVSGPAFLITCWQAHRDVGRDHAWGIAAQRHTFDVAFETARKQQCRVEHRPYEHMLFDRKQEGSHSAASSGSIFGPAIIFKPEHPLRARLAQSNWPSSGVPALWHREHSHSGRHGGVAKEWLGTIGAPAKETMAVSVTLERGRPRVDIPRWSRLPAGGSYGCP